MPSFTHIAPAQARKASASPSAASGAARPSATVIVPVFNEEAHLERNASRLAEYLDSIDDRFDCDVLFVDDGSSDASAKILDRLETEHTRFRVIHHGRNSGLCQAMKTGFANCRGSYAVTIDSDLSYSPDHIERLLDHIVKTGAEVVLASPYMEGGASINVPKDRLRASRWANWFLSKVSPEKLSTFTGMVRAYDAKFLRSLDLKSKGMDVNPEIIYKTFLLRGRVEEIPACLDWTELNDPDGTPRRTSFAVPWHTLAILFSGFVFRPFLFFLVPGVALAVLLLQVALPHPDEVGRDLYQLVLGHVLQGVFEGEEAVGLQLGEALLGRGADVVRRLLFGQVDHEVVLLAVLADDHALVNLGLRRGEEHAAVLEVVEGVGCGLAGGH
jgi:glycosyltransferase involved in cell wall biosynthesis